MMAPTMMTNERKIWEAALLLVRRHGAAAAEIAQREAQRLQWTSVRVIKKLRSVSVSTAPSSGASKLGHPVPLLNFVSEAKSAWPHPAQW